MVVFIDGDHETDSVLEDWAAIEPLLEPGDVVLFHDLDLDTVQVAWEQIHPTLEGSQLIHFATFRDMKGVLYQAENAELKALEQNIPVESRRIRKAARGRGEVL
jgi:hypothetical protein